MNVATCHVKCSIVLCHLNNNNLRIYICLMRRTAKLYNDIPAKYPLCLHANCPMADTCLHQLAFRRHEELGKHLTLINPALCTMQEGCPHYASARPVRFAKGFTNFQTRMFPQQYSKFMDMLVLHFGRNQYFMRRSGKVILSPEEQAVILNALKACGIDSHFDFDEYIESTYWE